jgi:hypothetical protein
VLISLPITTWVFLIYNFHFDDDVRFFGCFLHHPSSRKLSSRVDLLCFQLDAGLEGVCNHEYGSYVSCTAAGIEVLSTRLGVIWQCVKICFWGLGRRRNAGSTRDNQDLGLVLACLLAVNGICSLLHVYKCICLFMQMLLLEMDSGFLDWI